MRRFLLICLYVLALSGVTADAQIPASGEPFKLGLFRQGTRTFIGAVVRDTTVIDLGAADGAIARTGPALPRDMRTLIARYDADAGPRIKALVASVVGAARRPAYVRELSGLRVLPPVQPRIILNATLNYQEHADELAKNPGMVAGVSASDVKPLTTPPASMPGIWTRKPGDVRHNPYFFQKPTTAIIGHGEAIRIPPGRDQIDGECELTIVVGKTASRVSVDRAADYIFGYTIENDVSDRRGRQDDRHGSDWLVAKGFDTFAPIGPYVVPKEFVPDPQALAVRLTLNDAVMTNSTTARMTHTVFELLSFASHVLALQPGDLLDTGSPAGVGASRKLFMKPGDVSACTVEQVGTLRNPVAAAR